jgi:hypothetical protein
VIFQRHHRIASHAALLLFACAMSRAGGTLEVTSPMWNFGALTNVTRVSHRFVLRNTNAATVTVTRVVAGCDCVHGVIERTTVPAHGETTLECSLDLRSLSGNVTRTVSVWGSDSNSPLTAVSLTGFVQPLFRVIPDQLELNIADGQTYGAVEVVCLAASRLPFSKIESDNANFTGSVTAVSSNRFMVRLDAARTMPHGISTAELTLRSSDPRDPACVITVVARRPADLEIVPSYLSFARQSTDQFRILWVQSHGTEPMRLADVISSSGAFRCEIRDDASSGGARIYVSAAGLDAAMRGTNELRLKWISDSGKTIESRVPVFIRDTAAVQHAHAGEAQHD